MSLISYQHQGLLCFFFFLPILRSTGVEGNHGSKNNSKA